MNKRAFIKLFSALIASPAISPFLTWAAKDKLKNWAGNLEYSTDRLYSASSLEQVRSYVKKQNKLKVLGTRHCFNDIADSTDNFLSLKPMDELVAVEPEGRTVTVVAGMTYGQLCPLLHSKGFALHNLASLPHISIAGAVSTATHGSGEKNGNLATAVSALEIVTADGEVVKLSRRQDGEAFLGAVVGLGALGVITKVTLDIQPQAFDGAPEFFGAKRATKNLHPIAELSAENCTEQMGVPGPWYERLPHFRMGFTPSAGKELQTEYFVPRQHAIEAILAVERLRDQISPHLMISEIRTIAADNLWLSPCYEQPCVTIHFTWKQDWPAVKMLMPLIEKELVPFKARPHWGKLFTVPPADLRSVYRKLPDFIQLSNRYDPRGKFRNEFLSKNIFSS